MLFNKRFHEQVSLRNTASLILHSVHPQIHKVYKHIKGFQMSDRKETILITETFYHLISVENILEKTGLGLLSATLTNVSLNVFVALFIVSLGI